MKRRNVDCSKLRRPPKRAKITDGIYGSIFVYVKLLLVWGLVLMLDFIVDFRFEYLWPLWLLTQSLYDSFKYQGLAFSIFFVCITITSDVACYLLIPVQWLFLTASTYVWVQYVWQLERGITIPTVFLWLIFLYIEVMVRLKEIKEYPFHIDLCRPFAAHCVGYPVITMGFSFKSCISYRFRLIKQKDVQRENEFYMELLHQALPPHALQCNTDKPPKALTSRSPGDNTNQILSLSNGNTQSLHLSSDGSNTSLTTLNPIKHRSSTFWSFCRLIGSFFYQSDGSGAQPDDDDESLDRLDDEDDIDDDEACNNTANNEVARPPTSNGVLKNNITKLNNHVNTSNGPSTTVAATTVVTTATSSTSRKSKSTNITTSVSNQAINPQGLNSSATQSKDNNIIPRFDVNPFSTNGRMHIQLEADVRRLKTELQGTRNSEIELRAQLNNMVSSEKTTKTELQVLRQENENLQTKLHKLVTGKQQDKQNLSQLEKKLQEEKKQRTAVEQLVAAEKRRKSDESSAAAAASSRVPSAGSRGECTLDSCKTRRWELENELKQLRRDMKLRDDHLRQLERETQSLQQYRESQTEAEVLLSALGAMQDKTAHLESSLSAETRLKLDLFSALGEAKRQIEIQQAMLIQKEVELADLKSKVAEVMAFMPSPPSGGSVPPPSPFTSSNLAMRYSPSFANCGIMVGGNSYVTSALNNHIEPSVSGVNGLVNGGADHLLNKSILNPSASDYKPNTSQ